MSKKIEVAGGVLSVTDTISGVVSLIYPSVDSWIDTGSLSVGMVNIIDRGAYSPVGLGLSEMKSLFRSPLSNCVNSLGVAFTTKTFLEFVKTSLATATNNILASTGFAAYTDTQYNEGSPFALTADTDTLIPNNAGIIYDDQKPPDITTFWDATSQEITGRDGDNLDIMFYWKCTPDSVNSELDIWIDIGGAVGELYRQTILFRGTTEKGVMYTLPSAYTRTTWETNGGKIYVRSTSNMTMYGFTFNFDRSHKAIQNE